MREIIITEEDEEQYRLFLRDSDYIKIKNPNQREFIERLEPILYFLGFVIEFDGKNFKFYYNSFEKPYVTYNPTKDGYLDDLIIFMFNSVYKDTVMNKRDCMPSVKPILVFDQEINENLTEHWWNIFDQTLPQPKVLT